MTSLKTLGMIIIREIAVYRFVILDPRTPKFTKLLLLFTIFYALIPIDLIPDFIQIFGLLDDAVVIPLLVIAGLQLIPKEVLKDCRRKAQND